MLTVTPAEHILELQVYRDFIEYTVLGRLSRISGSKYGTVLPALDNTAVDALATCDMWKVGFVNGFPAWTKAGFTETPMKTLYNILGSVSNPSEMVNCESKLNNIKTSVSPRSIPVGDWPQMAVEVVDWADMTRPSVDLGPQRSYAGRQVGQEMQADDQTGRRNCHYHVADGETSPKASQRRRRRLPPRTCRLTAHSGLWRVVVPKRRGHS